MDAIAQTLDRLRSFQITEKKTDVYFPKKNNTGVLPVSFSLPFSPLYFEGYRFSVKLNRMQCKQSDFV